MAKSERINVVIPPELLDELDAAARRAGESRSAYVCAAVRAAIDAPVSGGGETMPAEAYRDMAAQAAALARQLEARDGQITALTDALQSSQDTLKASQALHAAALSRLESGGDDRDNAAANGARPGRWARLRAAWRG